MATYSFLTHTFSVGASGGSTTPSIDTTGANLIVAGIVYSTGFVPTLTDNKGNTWIAVGTAQGNSDESVQLFFCQGGTVGTGHTFTVTGSNSFSSVFIEAFSGSGGNPLDQNTGNQNTGSLNIATGSITPTADNELIVVMYGNVGNAGAQTMDSGMTLTDTQSASSPTWGSSMGYKIQTSATAINVTCGCDSSRSNAAVIASFKAATLTFVPPSGTLSLTGLAPTIAANNIAFTPSSGSLSLTGLAPSIRTNDIAFTPSAGSLVLSGNAPRAEFGITPPAGTLTLTGVAPPSGFSLFPASGVLALNSSSPRLGLGIFPPTANLTLTGPAPSITPKSPGTGSLALNGFAPAITIGKVVFVPFSDDIYAFPFWYSETYEFIGYNPNEQRMFLQYRNGVMETYCGILPWVAQNLADIINANQDPVPIISRLQRCDDEDTEEMPKPPPISVSAIPSTLLTSATLGTVAGNVSVFGGKPPFHWKVSPGPNNFKGFLNIGPSGTTSQLTLNSSGVGNLVNGSPLIGVVQVTDSKGKTASSTLSIPVNTSPVLPVSLFPDAGIVALTGLSPTLTIIAPFNLSPGSGLLALNGVAPTLKITAPIALSPPSGSLGLTGVAPTLNIVAPIALSPGSGSLSLTGSIPAMNAGGSIFLFPPSASLALNGNAPTLNVLTPVSLSPASASLGLTGNIPTLNAGGSISLSPPSATLRLTGNAPATDIGPLLTTFTAKNISGSTVSGDFFFPYFGLPFIPGKIPVGGAPIFKLADGTVCPLTPVSKPINSIDGNSLWWSAYIVRVPMTGQTPIPNGSSITVRVYSGGTIPSASGFDRSVYTAGGFDLNTEYVGLGGDMNLVGTWVSDLPTAIAANNPDDYCYANGPTCRCDRIRAPAMQAGAAHGYLETYNYIIALIDGSGGLAGYRYLPRPTAPYIDNNIGPGGANKNVLGFQTIKVRNGNATLVDLWGTRGNPQSFSIAAAGSTFTSTANKFDTGFLVRLNGGSLPPPFVAGTSYWVNATGFFPNQFQMNNDSGSVANGNHINATGAGSGAMQSYPYITPYASLFGATSTSRYQYVQGAGSMATDPQFLLTFDPVYLQQTGLVPPWDLSITGVQSFTPPSNKWYDPTVFSLMSSGPVTQSLADTGDRSDIGIIPLYQLNYLFTGSQSDEQLIRQTGLIGGRFSINLKSNVTKSLLVPNNGPNRNGSGYAGLPAPQPTLQWDAGNGFSSTSLIGTNSNCLRTGWGEQNSSHLPNFPYLPFILFGEPQYKDMMAEWAVASVLQAEIHVPDTTQADTVHYWPARRNHNTSWTGIHYYAANICEAGQRNGAWAIRHPGEASILDFDDFASYRPMFQDINAENGILAGVLIDRINTYNPFMAANGPYWETPNKAFYIDQWQDNYMMMTLAHLYQLTGDANLLKALTASTKWWDYCTQNFTAWNACINRANIRTSIYNIEGTAPPILTNANQVTFNGAGKVIAWANGSPNFTVNTTASGTNTLWVPTVNDLFMFFNQNIDAGPVMTPIPAAFNSSQSYYVVSVTPLGNFNYTIQLSATQGGSPINNTDSITNQIGYFFRWNTPPADGSLDSGGNAGYQAISYGAFKYAKALGVPVSNTTMNDLAFRTRNINFATNPKYDFAAMLP